MKKKITLILTGIVMVCAAVVVIHKLRKLESPKTDKPLIICIGDSITYGATVKENRKKEAWPYLLDERYETLNYGIPGATMQDNTNHPYKSLYWHKALWLKADIYFLMLGTNDIRPERWDEEQYIIDLNKKIQRLKTVSDNVILLVPPPVFKIHPEDISGPYNTDPALCTKLKEIIETTANEHHLPCIDLYSLMENHPEYMTDGVHPNKEGNQCIADMINTYLKEEIVQE